MTETVWVPASAVVKVCGVSAATVRFSDDFGSAGSARMVYADKLPFDVASLTAGSFGYRRAVLAGSPALGAGNLLYGLEYQQSDGPWQNPNDFAKYNGVARYSQGTSASGWNVTARSRVVSPSSSSISSQPERHSQGMPPI